MHIQICAQTFRCENWLNTIEIHTKSKHEMSISFENLMDEHRRASKNRAWFCSNTIKMGIENNRTKLKENIQKYTYKLIAIVLKNGNNAVACNRALWELNNLSVIQVNECVWISIESHKWKMSFFGERFSFFSQFKLLLGTIVVEMKRKKNKESRAQNKTPSDNIVYALCNFVLWHGYVSHGVDIGWRWVNYVCLWAFIMYSNCVLSINYRQIS